MGKGIVDALKNEFPINDEWLPFEIHPETPSKGVLLADYFKGMNMDAFRSRLNAMGQHMGIEFSAQDRLSNSRMAMEAGEFAKEHGNFEAYHSAVFKAFFTDNRDIGQKDVILDIANDVKLDTLALSKVLENGKYLPQLEETTRKARGNCINSAPTFIIEGVGTLVGAHPIETFRDALNKTEAPLTPL